MLTVDQAQAHLPVLEAPAINPMELLSTDLAKPVEAPPAIKARLAELRKSIAQRRADDERRRDEKLAAELADWQEKKRAAAEMAFAAMRSNPPPVCATQGGGEVGAATP